MLSAADQLECQWDATNEAQRAAIAKAMAEDAQRTVADKQLAYWQQVHGMWADEARSTQELIAKRGIQAGDVEHIALAEANANEALSMCLRWEKAVREQRAYEQQMVAHAAACGRALATAE